MFKIQTHYKAVAIAFFVLALSVLFGGKAHAATLSPAIGTDELTANSNCSLSEAITNINDQAATYTECSNTGDVYGTTDTINIPAGTVTLSADLTEITQPVSIHGAGMEQTTVDGLGLYFPFNYTSTTNTSFTVTDMKITGLKFGAILAEGGGSDINFSRLDIDGANVDAAQTYFGLGAINDGIFETNISINDVYIHDFNVLSGNSGFTPISVSNLSDASLTGDFQNITISNVRNDGLVQSLAFATNANGQPKAGNATATIRNVTVDNITSTQSLAAGLGGIAYGLENTVDIDVSNVTVSRLNGNTASFVPGRGNAAIFAATVGFDNVLQPHTTINVSNSHITASESCLSIDISPIVGAPGTGLTTITSQGGNLTDDTTCSPYFTQPTDKNNLTNLASTLAPLADNGGYVPTMALMQGSPAIDSGVTVAGLTTDARGSARPQGTAYDSGAYESPYSKPTNTSTLANTGENIGLLMMVSMATLASGLGLVLFRKFQS